jgi:hypothetical protein
MGLMIDGLKESQRFSIVLSCRASLVFLLMSEHPPMKKNQQRNRNIRIRVKQPRDTDRQPHPTLDSAMVILLEIRLTKNRTLVKSQFDIELLGDYLAERNHIVSVFDHANQQILGNVMLGTESVDVHVFNNINFSTLSTITFLVMDLR